MPTARGTIKSQGSRFTAVFLIDDIQYIYYANMDSSVPFTCNDATLTFDSERQLTSTREYHGKVGTNDVKFTLANGPTIAGELDVPSSSKSTVSGSGTWTQN